MSVFLPENVWQQNVVTVASKQSQLSFRTPNIGWILASRKLDETSSSSNFHISPEEAGGLIGDQTGGWVYQAALPPKKLKNDESYSNG